MRLIDADELVKAFNEAQVEFDEYYKGLGRAKVITDNAPTVSEFSDVELFLIEMALDEVLWKLEVDSPMYKKFSLMNLKVHGLRKGADLPQGNHL